MIIWSLNVVAKFTNHCVATIQRWEKLHGFPVRRTPSGSVFAYTEEIEAWLRKNPEKAKKGSQTGR